jgi:hypothetical protein
MSRPSSALASLADSYRFSEGEENAVEDDNEKSPNSKTPNIPSPIPARPRLVSYQDDTVISDDEGVSGERTEQERNEGDFRDGVQLPPEPTGSCSPSLQEKISRLYELMNSSDLDIQQSRNFRNPYLSENLIQFCGINEFGSNYPAQVYDHSRWEKKPSYEDLARRQNAEMDRRAKERKDKKKVQFLSGTKRRKSKWDKVGTMSGGTQAGHILKPAGLLQQPSLTTSVTGTKGKITSASGSFPKKPRI